MTLQWVLFISFKHSSGMLQLSSSSTGFLSTNQSDPYLHSLQLTGSVDVMPLEGMSAGLSIPGQCFQHSAGTIFLTSFTLFSTHSFHSLVIPLIQNSVTLESLKQHCGCNWMSTSSATDTLLMIFASNSVNSSSSFGMDYWTDPCF